MGWLQMARVVGERDFYSQKYRTFNFLTRCVAMNSHQAVSAPTGLSILFLPKSYYRFDKVWNKNIYFRNVSFMDDVIQLRRAVVYKYASVNIYVFSLRSLLWNVFILLNICGDKERSR